MSRAEININRPDIGTKYAIEDPKSFSIPLNFGIGDEKYKNSDIRVLVMSSDASETMELKSFSEPLFTLQRLRTLLSNEFLGINGHLDGISQSGDISGWAARIGDPLPCSIWLHTESYAPISVPCKHPRPDLESLGFSSDSGFLINVSELPFEWAGQAVWASFDLDGSYLLPQSGNIVIPHRNTLQTLHQASSTFTSGSREYGEQLDANISHHLQVLNTYSNFLDNLESQIDHRNTLLKSKKLLLRALTRLKRFVGKR